MVISPRTALVADDHMLTAEAIAESLAARRDFEVLGVVRSRADVSTHLATHRIGLLLTEVQLVDDPDGRVISEVLARSPSTRVVVVTSRTDDWSIARAIEGGCHAYVLKEQSLDELVAAIDAVEQGDAVFAAAVMSKVLRLLRPAPTSGDALTRRELDVLRSLAEGRTTQQIAAELFVSHNTVRNHISSLIRKLGAHSRLEAVSTAARTGLIHLR